MKCNKDGHEWTTTLGEIIRGAGCIKCAKIKTSELNLKPREEVLDQLDEISKGRYSYDRDFEYKGVVNSDYISCKCLVCDDEFETSLISLLQGHGCRKCANKTIGDKNRLDKEEVLKRLKNSSEGRYIWEDFDYFSTPQKIKLQCLRNGSHTWETSISNLIYGDKSGCPHCNPKYSKIETKIREYVESIVGPYGLEVEANNRTIIPSLKDSRFFMEVDIYIPKLKLGFEFNSEFYHTEERAIKQGFKSTEHKWKYKSEQCEKQGIKLIHISQKSYRSVSEMKKNMKLIKDEIMDRIGKNIKRCNIFIKST